MKAGEIVTLRFTDRDGGVPHPHLVVIPISGTKCIVVPCYTPGKPAVEDFIASRRGAMFDYQIFVTINHRACVTPIDPNYTWGEAHYVFEKVDVIDTAVLNGGKIRGTMSIDQVRRIAQGLLDMHAAITGGKLTPKAFNAITKFLTE